MICRDGGIRVIRGIYTSGAGMLLGSRRLEVLSHNVSNAETVGYRGDDSLFLSAPQHSLSRVASAERQPVGVLGMGTLLQETHTSQEQGELEPTGKPLDMSLVGPGFFRVLLDGEEAYTRAGAFKRDPDGFLVTVDGHPVLSEAGDRVMVPDGPVTFTTDGTVMVEGEVVDSLALVEFENPAALEKERDVFFLATDLSGAPQAAQETSVYQGYVERSNVDVLDHTLKLMMAARSYEASQRALKAQDDTLAMAVREVGRV